MPAVKQAQAQLLLERLDLPADRALGEAQLSRSKREAAMTRDRLEAAEQIQRREPILSHDRPFVACA